MLLLIIKQNRHAKNNQKTEQNTSMMGFDDNDNDYG